MSANLLELAKGYLNNDVVDKASSFIGEDQSTTESAFNHILPTLLGGMVSKSTDKAGASDLFGMVTRPEFGGGLLNNIGEMFSNKETANNTLGLGESLLGTLMGSRKNNVVDMISTMVGMNSNSTSDLLKMSLPLLLSVIGKKVKTDGLGLDGFMNLILDQDKYVKEAAPAGLFDKMLGAYGVSKLGSGITDSVTGGEQSVRDNYPKQTERAQSTVSSTKNEVNEKSGFARFLPILLIIGALVLAWLLWRSCETEPIGDDLGDDNIEQTNNAPMDDADNESDNVYNYIAGEQPEGSYDAETNRYVYDTGEMVELELPNGETITVSERGAEHTLYQLINAEGFSVSENKSQGWFTLDGVNFETGSANLTQQSHGKLENVAQLLMAYPEVNLKFGGYTDNVGDETNNQALSGRRAEAAMNKVVAEGIDASRLSAEGYGEEHPVCPANDTDECKAQNRRVDVRITQK